ncbi:hypothetical protein BRW62_07385 [Parathermosynechococcus lividus PCC 6715]|uniref:site-specific DNA-methyltransferase (adenine-specific) n=1 Tax=Parathermosynechococcus lividus PCC 6715 TaxID=1917166 RepID=A0A2D2Q297_PARLV|nr:DNA adenine methylase [Thermostichus lividus]ATS18606.1 hypothetical protein BRW62_07385 [Thermostichus lividus PCC 6715]
MSIHRVLVPPIKCQGIKTKLVPWIKAIIPADFDGRWIEPFMGSGVVVFNVRPRKALLADSNPHLINFYQAVAKGEITAYFDNHTNSGVVEGINNKLKLIKRSGYGFRNFDNFQLRCLICWHLAID